MMSDLIRFTRNYNDLSTDRGYQFQFYCDHCGDGYMSPYQSNKAGVASDLLRGAGRLFGGTVGRLGDATYDVQRAVGGKKHDEALRSAVEAVKPHFSQCSRCGTWVCKDVCWNTDRGLCVQCAPKLEQELSALQSEAQIEQARTKMREEIDFTKGLNLTDKIVARCPHCQAETKGGKFCLECGGRLQPEDQCNRCGTQVPAEAKFCPECGQARGK